MIPYPLCCDVTDFSELGPSYPMYFHFIVFLTFILACLMFTSGFYELWTNYQGEFCIDSSEYDDHHETDDANADESHD